MPWTMTVGTRVQCRSSPRRSTVNSTDSSVAGFENGLRYGGTGTDVANGVPAGAVGAQRSQSWNMKLPSE